MEKVVQASLSIPQCYAFWGHIQPCLHYRFMMHREMTDTASMGVEEQKVLMEKKTSHILTSLTHA